MDLTIACSIIYVLSMVETDKIIMNAFTEDELALPKIPIYQRQRTLLVPDGLVAPLSIAFIIKCLIKNDSVRFIDRLLIITDFQFEYNDYVMKFTYHFFSSK